MFKSILTLSNDELRKEYREYRSVYGIKIAYFLIKGMVKTRVQGIQVKREPLFKRQLI